MRHCAESLYCIQWNTNTIFYVNIQKLLECCKLCSQSNFLLVLESNRRINRQTDTQTGPVWENARKNRTGSLTGGLARPTTLETQTRYLLCNLPFMHAFLAKLTDWPCERLVEVNRTDAAAVFGDCHIEEENDILQICRDCNSLFFRVNVSLSRPLSLLMHSF